MSAAGAAARGARRPAARAVVARLAPGRRTRRRLLALLAVGLLLGAGYLLWLRDSSLVQVREVTITGLSSPGSGRIRAALGATAKDMTTLHLDREKLERAAAAFPLVRSIEVRPDFPHALRVVVSEHRPGALLVSGSRRVAVAGDGTVLTGLSTKTDLPLVRIAGAIPVKQVPAGPQMAAVKVAGGLPAAVAGRVDEVVRESHRGVVVPLKNGPKLIFGDATRVAAKWAAAVRVLGDPDAAGADYLDVRIPERPAAGGLPVETVAPVAPAQAPGSAGQGAAAPSAVPRAPFPPAGGVPPAPTPGPGAAPGAGTPASPLPQPSQPPGAGGGAAAPNSQP